MAAAPVETGIGRFEKQLLQRAAAVEEREADEAQARDPYPRDAWDDMYERQAARARSNDFADTGGKDWT